MPLPLPFKVDTGADAADPEAVQADLDEIAKQFPLSRKHMKVEPAHNIGDTGEPAFASSWTNFDTTAWRGARFWKDPMGLVHIEGLVKGGTPGAASVVFVLPVGYRPGNGLLIASYSAAGAARIDIAPAGNVIVNVGSTTWTSITIPPFRQEQ